MARRKPNELAALFAEYAELAEQITASEARLEDLRTKRGSVVSAIVDQGGGARTFNYQGKILQFRRIRGRWQERVIAPGKVVEA